MTTTKQALIQVRVDKDLRDEATDIYERIGLDVPTAIRMFFKRSVMERGLPFETTLPSEEVSRSEASRAFEALRAQASDLPKMTNGEINAEIAAVRRSRRAQKR